MDIEQLKQMKAVVDELLNYSNTAIIRNNFIKNFYAYSIPDSDGKNHRLYGEVKLFGAKTFRLTSSKPNLLNMPSTRSAYAKAVKKCFIAEPEHIIYQVDLNALEDRVMANLSLDQNKIAVFKEGIDGHCLNSYYYFKNDIEKILPRDKDEPLYDYIRRYFREIEENKNKELKLIRQKSKGLTFGLAYGIYPAKMSKSSKLPMEQCQEIFDNYHGKLYPDITKFREGYVLETANRDNKLHLGLGCYIDTDDAQQDIRTLNNACIQFWSILSLLTVSKFNQIMEEKGLKNNVNVIATIYDSIYIHLPDNTELIKEVNDIVIPLITTDFMEDQTIPLEACGEIGYNWTDSLPVYNDATIEDIEKVRLKLQAMKETTSE